jgi:pilus assembly protein Flp/PilA
MRKLKVRQKGQGLVEYALILVLVAVVVLVVLALLGDQVNQVFARIVLEMQYPGEFHGDPVQVDSITVTAQGFPTGPYASTSVSLGGGVSAPVCVQFSVSGGESTTVCGGSPGTGLNGPSNGTVTACVIGVKGYSMVGGTKCATDTY